MFSLGSAALNWARIHPHVHNWETRIDRKGSNLLEFRKFAVSKEMSVSVRSRIAGLMGFVGFGS